MKNVTRNDALEAAKKLTWGGWMGFWLATGGPDVVESDGWPTWRPGGGSRDDVVKMQLAQSGVLEPRPSGEYKPTELGDALQRLMTEFATKWGSMAMTIVSLEDRRPHLRPDDVPGAELIGVSTAGAALAEYGLVEDDRRPTASKVFPYKATVFCKMISIWHRRRMPLSLEALAEGVSLSEAAQMCMRLGADLRTLAVLDQTCRERLSDPSDVLRADVAMRLTVIQSQASLLVGFLDIFLERVPKTISDLGHQPVPPTH